MDPRICKNAKKPTAGQAQDDNTAGHSKGVGRYIKIVELVRFVVIIRTTGLALFFFLARTLSDSFFLLPPRYFFLISLEKIACKHGWVYTD